MVCNSDASYPGTDQASRTSDEAHLLYILLLHGVWSILKRQKVVSPGKSLKATFDIGMKPVPFRFYGNCNYTAAYSRIVFPYEWCFPPVVCGHTPPWFSCNFDKHTKMAGKWKFKQ